MLKSLITLLIVSIIISSKSNLINARLSDGSWNGSACVGCVYLVGMTEHLTIVYNQTVDKSLEKLCNYFPQGLFRTTCQKAIDTYGDVIINGLYARETPDVICNLLGFCESNSSPNQCHLFPLPKNSISLSFATKRFSKYLQSKNINVPTLKTKICDSILFKPLCQYLINAFTFRNPGIDLDGDSHSTHQSLRGSDWKGRDCNDYDSNIKPGRIPTGNDDFFDTNCNGIYGKDIQSSQSYEELFCKNSGQKGIAVLGDSISAHFHIPEEWFDAFKINEASFQDLTYFIENELDWPQLSAITGYMNSTWRVTQGPTRSIYLYLSERNRCNHRDYQNVAVNGAKTETMKTKFSKGLKRNQKEDQPLLVYYSLIGNDVCNGEDDTLNNMTKPADFYNNIVATMQYLDTVLPNGSHVILTGLANGSVLYDALNARIHPIGLIKNDVTYGDFYTWMTCLKLSPCNGWMTSNATLSKLTTEYASMLSGLVKNVTETFHFKNFDMAYIDLPVDKIFSKWIAMGHEIWELIEPIDGFHMNQYANALLADEIWSILEDKYPKWIGEINPYNDDIIKIFGNQNGF